MSGAIARIRRIRESGGHVSFPENVYFELTHSCNLQCRHCFLAGSRERRLLPTRDVQTVLDGLARAGAFTVLFTGGEVLTRPDFFEIAEHARAAGLFHCLSTNGFAVTETVAKKIARSNPTQVDVSLHGATSHTQDAITGVDGSFERVVRGLHYLAAEGARVTVKTTVMQQNFQEVPQIAAIAEEVGAHHSADPMIAPCADGCSRPLSNRLTDEQMMDFVRSRWLTSMGQVAEQDAASERKPPLMCSAGRSKCAVSPTGDVYPCVLWRERAGNALKEDFAEIWQGPVFARIRNTTEKELPACYQCDIRGNCVRCPGFSYLEGHGFLGPSTEVCRMTRIATEVMRLGGQEEVRTAAH